VDVVSDFYFWIDHILFYCAVVLRVWAVIDCAIRKPAAFTAVNKLTKLAWLSILIISGALGSLFFQYAPDQLIPSISVVIALVYLCDVRPAVREVSGGR
jgi:hypothetical protein